MNVKIGEIQEKITCNGCKTEVTTIVELLESGPHYAKETCANCGKFIRFSKKPSNEKKRPPNKFLPKDLDVDHCQMCLRSGERLGRYGVLESHHVVEIKDNGQDVPSNIWVLCSSCHRLVHHQRVYINDHLKGYYSITDLKRDMVKDGVPAESQEILERIFLLHDAKFSDI